MVWSLVLSFTIIAIIMYIGECFSTKTGGKLPQMFIVALIFLIGFWFIFPKDIIDTSGFAAVANITKLFILIHVGAMFEFKQIIKNWKVVVITIAAMIGLCAVVLPIGTMLFGWTITAVATPPLTGGGMAAMIMQDAANKIGKPELGMLAMIVFIMQGFVGFPLTAIFLNKEGKRLVTDFRKDPSKYTSANEEIAATVALDADMKEIKAKTLIIEIIPKKYRTPTFYLAQLGIFALIVDFLYNVCGQSLDKSLIAVFVGIIAKQVGLLESDPMGKSESSGILNTALFVSFMSSFAVATPELLLELLVPIIVLLILATIGILIVSIIVGKKLGYSLYMSSAIGLNCFLGFPYNYALTKEAVNTIAENENETTYLNDEMMPKMIIGSIIAVSLVSTLFAGILINYL